MRPGSAVIRHKGVVTCTDPLTVQVTCQSACAACHAKGVCGLGQERLKEITHIRPPKDFTPQVGQTVELLMQEKMGFKALWWAMGVPFLLMAAAVTLCVILGTSELFMGISALVIIGIYFLVLYLLKAGFQYEFNISLYRTDS